jgi:hypothetical protein
MPAAARARVAKGWARALERAADWEVS